MLVQALEDTRVYLLGVKTFRVMNPNTTLSITNDGCSTIWGRSLSWVPVRRQSGNRSNISRLSNPRLPCLESEVVEINNRVVANKVVEVNAPCLPERVSIWPPLDVGVIEAVAIVIHPAVGVTFLGAKTIHIRRGECSAGGNRVPKRVIPISRNHILIGVHHVCDVPASVRMIIVVVRPTPTA